MIRSLRVYTDIAERYRHFDHMRMPENDASFATFYEWEFRIENRREFVERIYILWFGLGAIGAKLHRVFRYTLAYRPS